MNILLEVFVGIIDPVTIQGMTEGGIRGNKMSRAEKIDRIYES